MTLGENPQQEIKEKVEKSQEIKKNNESQHDNETPEKKIADINTKFNSLKNEGNISYYNNENNTVVNKIFGQNISGDGFYISNSENSGTPKVIEVQKTQKGYKITHKGPWINDGNKDIGEEIIINKIDIDKKDVGDLDKLIKALNDIANTINDIKTLNNNKTIDKNVYEKIDFLSNYIEFDEKKYEAVPIPELDNYVLIRNKDKTEGILINIKDGGFYYYSDNNNEILDGIAMKTNVGNITYSQAFEKYLGAGKIASIYDNSAKDIKSGKINKRIIGDLVKQ